MFVTGFPDSIIVSGLCRYIQCLHQKLYHLSAAEYDEFINIVMSARAAFLITPEGAQQFKEWLQSIRRSVPDVTRIFFSLKNRVDSAL